MAHPQGGFYAHMSYLYCVSVTFPYFLLFYLFYPPALFLVRGSDECWGVFTLVGFLKSCRGSLFELSVLLSMGCLWLSRPVFLFPWLGFFFSRLVFPRGGILLQLVGVCQGMVYGSVNKVNNRRGLSSPSCNRLSVPEITPRTY